MKGTNAQIYKLEKVVINELQEKKNSKDTSASATILYKKARTFFSYKQDKGFMVNHEYEYKIKIYKKEGLKWATFEVPYYTGYENLNDDSVAFSNCNTYNLEDNKIEKTKLNNQGVFNKKINKYWKQAIITMPNVKVGSIIEFKYIYKSENIVKFPVFENQYEIPLNYSEYKTEIPEYFIYKPIQIGYIAINTDDKIVIGSQHFTNQNNQEKNISYRQINTTFITENIPAITKESYVDNWKNYKSSIHHELEKTRFPESPVEDYSLTWEGVANKIYKEDGFGKELKEFEYFTNDVNAILRNINSPREKLEVLFKFVQNKMNWNGERGFYVDKGVKVAYIENTGNTAEINFILIAMLRSVGIDANPVLISTIDNGIPVFPSRTVFNYVIVGVEIDGEQILLDASNKLTCPNILPLEVLNWTGRLIRQNASSKEINLVPKLTSNKNYAVLATIKDNGVIEGKVRIQKSDYEALDFRENYSKINTESYLEKLEIYLKLLKATDYLIENKKFDLKKPVIETFTFVTDNNCEVIGDKMYLDPMLFFTLAYNPFMQEKRQMPIYFGYPKQEKYNITFEIPEGYSIESVPSPRKIATPENISYYSFNSLFSENKIQISVIITLNSAIVSAEFYDVLKDFYRQMINKQNERIILKKLKP